MDEFNLDLTIVVQLLEKQTREYWAAFILKLQLFSQITISNKNYFLSEFE